MRFFICLLLAMPVYAQAPNNRRVEYQCDPTLNMCVVKLADWQWVVEAMQAKDAELARLRAEQGCGPWKDVRK
jgi:hypothetical protein